MPETLLLPRQARPSYKQGYARSIGASAYPECWPDYGWVPGLGYTGNVLYDLSRRYNGTFNSATQPAAFGPDSIAQGNQQVLKYTAKVADSYIGLGNVLDFQMKVADIWTVIACGSMSDASTTHDHLAFWRGGDRRFVMRTSSGTAPRPVQVFHGSAVRITTPSIIEEDTWYTWCVDNDGTGSATGMRIKTFDKLGMLIDTSTGDATADDTDPSNHDLWGRDGGDAWQGLAGPIYFYKRVLNDGAARKIARDNLAPVRQRSRLAVLPVAAPAGGLDIQIAQHHYHQLAGV